MSVITLLQSPAPANVGDQGTGSSGEGAGNPSNEGRNDGANNGGDIFDDADSGGNTPRNQPPGSPGGSSSGNNATNTGGENDGGDGNTDSNDGPTGNASGDQNASAGAAFSATEVAAILAAANVQNQGQGQGGNQGQGGRQNDVQMTPEEFNRQFNVYQPTNEVLIGLRSDDPKVQMAAFIAMRDGMMKQALTMSEYRYRQLHGDFVNNQFSEVQSYVAQERAQRERSSFFKTNPDLKPYETMIDAVANGLEAKGHKFKSVSEAHKAYAAEVRTMLKAAGINLAGNGQNTEGRGAGQNQPNGAGNGQPSRPQRKMSTLAGGGQPGGGRSSGAPSGPPGIEVFE